MVFTEYIVYDNYPRCHRSASCCYEPKLNRHSNYIESLNYKNVYPENRKITSFRTMSPVMMLQPETSNLLKSKKHSHSFKSLIKIHRIPVEHYPSPCTSTSKLNSSVNISKKTTICSDNTRHIFNSNIDIKNASTANLKPCLSKSVILPIYRLDRVSSPPRVNCDLCNANKPCCFRNNAERSRSFQCNKSSTPSVKFNVKVNSTTNCQVSAPTRTRSYEVS